MKIFYEKDANKDEKKSKKRAYNKGAKGGAACNELSIIFIYLTANFLFFCYTI
jgi:hypothetical protein